MAFSILRSFINSDVINDPPASDAVVYAWVIEVVGNQRDATNDELIVEWGAPIDIIGRLRATSDGPAGLDRGLADALLTLIEKGGGDFGGGGLALTNPSIQAFLSSMEPALISQSEIDDLNAIATEQIPRWQKFGLSAAPNVADIPIARAE